VVADLLGRDLALAVHIADEIFGPAVLGVVAVEFGGLEVDHVLHCDALVVMFVPDRATHALVGPNPTRILLANSEAPKFCPKYRPF
jgi:hypothetical protein